ncbi:hypothetical protein I6A60_24740 [Frankia sp. AgB1.9]|uniref:LysM peptidoglycan-binding domain-containing protein n=1 Tax=unclassified Frankia TaxID=2632575 RepID=UPI001933BFB8|nr:MULTISPECIES: LysM domain-containing protein [unclassified Frankia]MBL7487434.1 hypothetical protein [Frankia sp. AgW1.1]MBL7551048.1 hypothetical protein [Frankia sp. AgB1.9]MBL7618829.1 hypothetical protein [Frankia sp. AgB1.8]
MSRRASSAPARSTARRAGRPGAGEILRSLFALVTMVGFLGGVPLLLWTWRGYPLPTTFQPERWWNLLRAGFIHPDVLPNSLATAGWLLWAWPTLCIAWEIVTQAAAARRRAIRSRRHGAVRAHPFEPAQRPGRQASDRPGNGGRVPRSADTRWDAPATSDPRGVRPGTPAPRAVRRGAARWVATAGVAITLLTSRAALAASPATVIPTGSGVVATAPANLAFTAPPSSSASLTVDALLAATTPSRPTATTAGENTSASTGRTTTLQPTTAFHTVQPGDTLWAIAAHCYPTATYAQLPAVVDAVFTTNLGTPDPAGRRLVHPSLINPGMLLVLPTVTASPEAQSPRSDPTGAGTSPNESTPTASPTPNSSGPATGGTPTTRTPVPAPASEAQGLTPPASTSPPAPSSARPTGPPPPTPSWGLAPVVPVVPPTLANPSPTAVEHHQPSGPSAQTRYGFAPWQLATGLGGGLLAAAVLSAVAFRRRRRDHQVIPATAPPPPDQATAEVHTALLATTPPDRARRLDHALRALALLHATPDADGPLPQVVLTRPTGTLDVYLLDPIPSPPSPWEPDADGQVWTLPADATLPTVDDGLPPPCPALVQLGTQPDGALVHADLEALGVLTLDPAGHGPDAVASLARALLTTLALSPFAEAPLIRTVGLDPAGLATEWRVHPAVDLGDLLASTVPETAQLRADLAAIGAPTTLTARATAPDNWDPTIALVATSPTDDAETDQLVDLALLAAPGSTGLALVQPAESDYQSTWSLTLLPATSRDAADEPHTNGPTTEPTDQSDEDPDDLDDGLDVLDDADEDDSADEMRAWPRAPVITGHRTGTGPHWRLDPLGLVLTPTTLAAAELAALCDLLADVVRPPIPALPLVPPFPPPSEDGPASPPAADYTGLSWPHFLSPTTAHESPLDNAPQAEGSTSRPAAYGVDGDPFEVTRLDWPHEVDLDPPARPEPLPGPIHVSGPHESSNGYPRHLTPAPPADPIQVAGQDTASPAWTPVVPDAAATHRPIPVPAEPGALTGRPDSLAADSSTEAEVSPPPYVEPNWQVMVHFYGPLIVTSRAGKLPTGDVARGRNLEVLAWLATHRNRTRIDLEAAVWPSGVRAKSIHNQLGSTRKLLVQLAGPDAAAWIPTGTTILRLDPAVTTDLHLLEHRLAYALRHQNHPDTAIPVLAGALDLVNGTPATHSWFEAELGSALTTSAVRAAALLAELHLARGDTTAALTATTRGLAILPAHPDLFGIRLRAHAANGDPAAVTADYHAYLRAEQADPLNEGDTNSDLAHLHRHLVKSLTVASRPRAERNEFNGPGAGSGDQDVAADRGSTS